MVKNKRSNKKSKSNKKNNNNPETLILIVNKIKSSEKPTGKHFDVNPDTIIVNSDTDGYYEDPKTHELKTLFKFRKNVIPVDLGLKIRNNFEKFAKKNVNDQRAKASGVHMNMRGPIYKSEVKCRSAIAGYFNKPLMNQKKYFNTTNVTRQTAYSKNYKEKWSESIDFFEHIGKLYKKLAPEYYNRQNNFIKKINPKFRIGQSPFTTITINYNWRTACHYDKGDYSDGLGNLTVLGDNSYKGGYLFFPEFNVAVNVRPYDFLLMDVHQYHCNTPLDADDNRVRLSFVCYLREKMINCKKLKVINGEEFYYEDK